MIFFNNYEHEGLDVPPSNIFNYDETNFSDDPGAKKCVFRCGVRYPERVMASSKASTSVMICGSADGKVLPPYVVYKATHLWNTWVEGGSDGSRYNRSFSGWFDLTCFRGWFESLFVPQTRKLTGPVLLIGDFLSWHFSYEVLKLAEKCNIRFLCLPKNATHLMQPLDVAFFRPANRKGKTVINDWKLKTGHHSKALSKDQFPK